MKALTQRIRPCGPVAIIGVPGTPVTLHLKTLPTRDVTMTTGLVDTYTIPRLMNLGGRSRMSGPQQHRPEMGL